MSVLLEIAAQDSAAAVRRRAAALAAAEGFDDLVSRFSSDADKSVRRTLDAARRESPAPPDPADEVLQAVQAALFGLTESELAEHIVVPEPQAIELASKLLAEGRLGRRGKRLVLAAGGAQ